MNLRLPKQNTLWQKADALLHRLFCCQKTERGMKLELLTLKTSEIKPYGKNARKNDQAVDAVAKSIQQCSYIAPIVVDENHIILAGHTRWKALKKLGHTECECIVKDGLTDEQKRKYRLLDNKTSEIADWDADLLAEELEGLDFGDLDLNWGISDEESYDFSDFDIENESLEGMDTEAIKISVPKKDVAQVVDWLANGEKKTAVGLGVGVRKRCGLL